MLEFRVCLAALSGTTDHSAHSDVRGTQVVLHGAHDPI